MVYSSESEFPVLAISLGKANSISSENLDDFLNIANVEGRKFLVFENFFEPLIKIEDWYNEEEKAMSVRFRKLKRLMEDNLRDLCCVKTGKIKQKIFVIGIDGNDNLIGIQTKATET